MKNIINLILGILFFALIMICCSCNKSEEVKPQFVDRTQRNNFIYQGPNYKIIGFNYEPTNDLLTISSYVNWVVDVDEVLRLNGTEFYIEMPKLNNTDLQHYYIGDYYIIRDSISPSQVEIYNRK